MTQPPDDAFSRYELLVLHRLKALEDDTKLMHRAFEELRVELVTIKSDVLHAAEARAQETKANAAKVALAISTLVALTGAVAHYFI